MRKKLAAIVFTGLMTVSLAACGSAAPQAPAASPSPSPSPSAAAQPSSSPAAKPSASNEAMVGRVTAIDGNSITLAVMTQNAPDDNSGKPEVTPGEKPPAVSGKPSTDNTMSPSAAQPPRAGKPSGAAPSSQPGAAPSGTPDAENGSGTGNGQFVRGFSETGETKTITVTATTTIFLIKDGTETAGTISDIKTGDILTVTMTGDTVDSITIGGLGGGQAAVGEDAAKGNPNGSQNGGGLSSGDTSVGTTPSGVRPLPAAQAG